MRFAERVAIRTHVIFGMAAEVLASMGEVQRDQMSTRPGLAQPEKCSGGTPKREDQRSGAGEVRPVGGLELRVEDDHEMERRQREDLLDSIQCQCCLALPRSLTHFRRCCYRSLSLFPNVLVGCIDLLPLSFGACFFVPA